MKICPDHWKQCREAIEKRGLNHLIKSSDVALENMKKEISGEELGKRDYDPLMTLNWMITGQALKLGGLYLMTAKEDGSEYCPLCEVEKHLGDEGKTWIDGASDSILAYCKEHGLQG